MKKEKNSPKKTKEAEAIAAELCESGGLAMEKNYMQHGETTVYEHSMNVAETALGLADKLHIKVHRRSLLRGALLHDYFLYDWHNKSECPKLHAFVHPLLALKNAESDYKLNSRERNIIRCHMFPLLPLPPLCREAWLVCIADKHCALKETLKPKLQALLYSITAKP